MMIQGTLFDLPPLPRRPHDVNQEELFDDDPEAERASDLISVLADWVSYQDMLEDHWSKDIGKRYANTKETADAYKKINEYGSLVRVKRESAGFTISDMMEIIPPPFETDWRQRKEILEDLKTWSIKEFGEYVIPF